MDGESSAYFNGSVIEQFKGEYISSSSTTGQDLAVKMGSNDTAAFEYLWKNMREMAGQSNG